MSVVELVLLLILIGIGLYLVNRIMMAQSIKTIINVVVVGLVVIWLLELFGLMHAGGYVGPRRW